MDNITRLLKKYKLFAFISGSLLIISGAAYASGQLIINGKIADIIFIGLGIGESFFILLNGYWILRYLTAASSPFKIIPSGSELPGNCDKEYSEFIGVFGNLKLILPVILIWAAGSAVLPFIRHYWNTESLSVLFAIFLFFINVVTAYFLILLFAYFIYSWRLWNLIDVELWKRENNSAHFLFGLSRNISLYGTVYVMVSIVGWLTSPIIPVGREIILIIIISVLILISSIIFPTLPYIRKISQKKQAALLDIDEKIQKEYTKILDHLEKEIQDIKFDRINSLMEMRQRIESIQPFPYKVKTLSTAVSIILISSIPIFIQYVFNKIFK